VSRQKQQSRILLTAVALTFVLGGAGAGGWAVHRWWGRRVSDPAFVKAMRDGGGSSPAAGRGGPQAALVRVARARVEKVQLERPIVGRLVEVRRATVSSEISGKIVEMGVREGSPVVGGKTVLARVDAVWLDLQIARQVAHMEVVAAQLRKEKHNLDRLESLRGRGVTTDHEMIDQRALHDQRQAELMETEMALLNLYEQRSRSEILAPFDGWVTARQAEVGQWLSPGSPVVGLVSRGEVYSLMHVPESLVNQLAVGLEIPVRVDALGETFRGKIQLITPDGAKASRTYPVRVALSDRGGRLKVGMSTTGTFPAGPHAERIMVSRDAVLIKPDGSTVWVVPEAAPRRAHPAPVEVVGRVGDRYAVLPLTAAAGTLLGDGATVVVEGAERLRPREPVRLMRAALAGGNSPSEPSGGSAPSP